MKDLENKTLKELFDLLPSAVEYGGKQYDLTISRGKRWNISYMKVDETINVSIDEVKFTKKFYLFDTFRSDESIENAIKSMLTLLHENKELLSFIPRIHPFQINFYD